MQTSFPRSSAVALVVVILGLLWVGPVIAGNVEQDFRDYMTLVLRDPPSFGFTDRGEAEAAKLGFCYGFYTIDEWKHALRKNGGRAEADPEMAPDKIYEVTTVAGELRAAFAFARSVRDGRFTPAVLGRADLVPVFEALRRRPDRARLVLLLDPSNGSYHCADTETPGVVLNLAQPDKKS
jgi:hypothetical protein